MEQSDFEIYKEKLKERLKEFFKREGFKDTKIEYGFNADNDGDRMIVMEIKVTTLRYSNKD